MEELLENTDEVVRALRNDYVPDLHVFNDMQLAGDLLERQQVRIVDLEAQLSKARLDRNAEEAFKNHYKARLAEASKQIRSLRGEIAERVSDNADTSRMCMDLRAQLTESQQQPQAAKDFSETASDGTGYMLEKHGEFYAVLDDLGHVVCEFMRVSQETEEGETE